MDTPSPSRVNIAETNSFVWAAIAQLINHSSIYFAKSWPHQAAEETDAAASSSSTFILFSTFNLSDSFVECCGGRSQSRKCRLHTCALLVPFATQRQRLMEIMVQRSCLRCDYHTGEMLTKTQALRKTEQT